MRMDRIEAIAESPEGTPYAYLLMKVAAANFGKSPRELEAADYAVAQKLASKEHKLQEIILASTEALGALVPEEVMAEAVQNIRARYADGDEFQSDLAQNQLDEDMLRAALARELRVEAALEKVSARSAAVHDVDVQLYYYLHLDKLVTPERRRVRHILITVNDDIAENRREAALARCEAVLDRLRKQSWRFIQQAGRYSECPTALNGGLIGTVVRGQLYPQLDAALFAMQAGECSGIISSELGFHILYCEAVEPARQLTLAEAQSAIRQKLEAKQKRRCQGLWLKNLYKQRKERSDE